ncbi:YfhO family protein, partial [Myxococcota bacterium]|nr:YfhO family protein [Myxococcota bacterium]
MPRSRSAPPRRTGAPWLHAVPRAPGSPSAADTWTPAAAAACVLLVLAPCWAAGRIPVRDDAGAYFWPLRAGLAGALRTGTPSLLDALPGGGAPLLLNPQAQALYPPAGLYGVLPLPWAFALLHALHLLLLGAGTHRLLRRLHLPAGDAALGALTVALGGAALSASAMQDKLCTLAWIPWLAAAALGVARGRRGGAAEGLQVALTTAMGAFAGGLDVLAMSVPLVLLLAATDGGQSGLVDRATALRAVRLGAWTAAGLGLAAVQWLPFLEWMDGAAWGGRGASPGELLARPVRMGNLLGLVAPNAGWDAVTGVLGVPGSDGAIHPWLPGIYAGGAGLVLGGTGLAVAWRRPGPARGAATLLLGCAALGLGRGLPGIGSLVAWVPLLGEVRYPQKWALPGALLAAVLVAEGAGAVRRAPAGSRGARAAVALPLVLGAGAAAAALLLGPGGWGRWARLAAGSLLLGAAVVALWRRAGTARGPRPAALAGALSAVLLAADLAGHNADLVPLAPPDVFWSPPPATRALAAVRGPVRAAGWGEASPKRPPSATAPARDAAREALYPGFAAADGLSPPEGWLAMRPRGWVAYFEATRRAPAAEAVKRLRLAGATHLLVRSPVAARDLAGVPGVTSLPGGAAPGRLVDVEVLALPRPLPDWRLAPRGDPDDDGVAARPTHDAGGRLAFAVDAPSAGFLVGLRPWEAGWRARVDGVRAPVLAAHGFQVAVPVPPGRHRVDLEYRPPGLGTGAAVTAATALGLGALPHLRRRRGGPAPPPEPGP